MTRLTRRMMEQLEIGGRVRVVREQVSRGIVGLVGMGVDVRVEMDTVRGVARENMMLREVKVVLVKWGRALVQARMVPEEGTVHGQTTREIKLSTTPRLRHCHLSLPVLITDCICSTLRHLVTILSTEPR